LSKQQTEILIIGTGLAGATAALTAADEGKKFTILKQVQSKIEVFYQRAQLTPQIIGLRNGVQTANAIVAAAIEQNHDDKGIAWPEALSPFEVVIVEVNPKKNLEVNTKCMEIYTDLKENNIDVLWDDRDKRAGVKFTDMELIGIPKMIIVGEKSLETNKVEFKRRSEEKFDLISPHEIIESL
jgi:prolyl-tRNA synthetase